MRVVRVVYYLLHVLGHSVCSWKYVVWPLTELTLVTRHARLSLGRLPVCTMVTRDKTLWESGRVETGARRDLA